MQRFSRAWPRVAVLAAALAAIVFVSFTAVGFPGGILFAVALGAATGVAVFSDAKRRNCPPRSREKE